MMFKIIDCSQRIEKLELGYDNLYFTGLQKQRQFQEFGLKWFRNGFTYITTPKWIDINLKI